MKKINVELTNDRQYKEEFILCRKKHVAKLSHEYTWVGSEDTVQWVEFPISADVVVARYHHNGNDWTEMSIVRIQNGKEMRVFCSDNLEDYDHFQEVVEGLKKKGFQQLEDCDYVA